MQEKWYKEGVVYQIYPRSFKDSNSDGIGDVSGIIEKIPYLKEIGIDILWVSPIYKSPMVDNGYDISDYYDINPEFGTLEDVKKLIKELHKYDIKLVMDLVINHTSSEHEWFKRSIKKDGKYKDYYHWEDKPINWTGFFGQKAWTYNEERKQYYLHLFAKEQPDLNYENKYVREDVKKIMKFWLDLGVDGFRCDVINLIAKNNKYPKGKFSPILVGKEYYLNQPKLHDYLKEFNEDVFSKYDMFTVGETVFIDTETAKLLTNPKRKELNMIFQFDHMQADCHYVKWFMKKFKPMNLKKPLSKWQNELNGVGWNTLYLENHDQPRSINRFGSLKYWYESATMLATMLYFQQGTPFIYQGQEIGMTNSSFTNLDDYKDLETYNIYKLGRKFLFSHKRMMKKIMNISRDNGRTPMQWDNTTNGGFSDGEPWIKLNPNYIDINVEKQINDESSILSYYKKIIKLRKEYKTIVYGNYSDIDFMNKKIYSYKRYDDNYELIIICNFVDKNYKFDITKYKEYKLLLTNYKDNYDVFLKPYEARVYIKKYK